MSEGFHKHEINHVTNLAEQNSKHIASILTGLEYLKESISSLHETQKTQNKQISTLQHQSVENKLVRRVVFGMVGIILTAFVTFLVHLFSFNQPL